MNILYTCTFIIVTAIVIFLALQFRKHDKYLRENQYIGFGNLLNWNSEDGSVNILVRLTDSPAGRAGIPNHCKLLAVDGIPISFTTSEDYYKWANAPREIGESHVYRVQTGNGIMEVTLVAEMIQGPIPYHDPKYRELSSDEEHLVHRGILPCTDPLTGQVWFERTQRLTNDAIAEVLG